MSPIMNVSGDSGVSSSVVCEPTELMVGASFTELTVKTKVLVVDCKPSLTVTEIVVVPKRLAAGARRIVRFAPLPLSTAV